MKLLSLSGFMHYEDGVDSIANVLFEGFFTERNINSPFVFATGKWLFFDKLFDYSYYIFPSINWYAAIIILLSSFNVILFLSIIRHFYEFSKETIYSYKNFVLLGICFFYLENLFFIQYTRIAYLLSFLGLLFIILHYLKYNKIKYSTLLIGIVSFTIGTFIRIESALLSIFVLIPFIYYLYKTNRVSLTFIAKLLAFPLFISTIISILINISNNADNNDIKLYNRFLHNADGNQYKYSSLNISNKQDSLAYEITLMYFMNDPKHINEAFINRINLNPMISLQSISDYVTNYDKFIVKLYKDGFGYLSKRYGYFLLFLISGIVLLLSTRNKPERLFSIIILIFYLAFFLLISGYIKMENRVYSPLFLSYSIIIIAMIKHESIADKNHLTTLVVTFVLLLSVLKEFSKVNEILKEKHNAQKYFETNLNEAYKQNITTLIFDLKGMQMVHPSPFESMQKRGDINYITIDNGILFITEAYKRKMKKITGESDDMYSFWKHVLKEKNNIAFLSQEYRMVRIIEYFNNQYNLSMKVKSLKGNVILTNPLKSDRIELYFIQPE